jgi:phosphatidylserine/phosphatidylglycerophosphate/cardiolipin synthase-like enzyme
MQKVKSTKRNLTGRKRTWKHKGNPAVTRIIQHNQITLLQNGEAYFPAIEAALDRAVYEIYLESYIFANDNTGRRIAEALRRAAFRGVKTHVLIDGFGSKSLPKTMVDYLVTAGVMVLKFRPKISPWTLRRQRLRRLHRKIVVVDQEIAFVGGINIIDDMDMPGQTSPRYDYAVSVEGPLVKQIHEWPGPACVLAGAGTTTDKLLQPNPGAVCAQLFWYGITSAIAEILKMPIGRRLNRRNLKSFLQMPIFCPD